MRFCLLGLLMVSFINFLEGSKLPRVFSGKPTDIIAMQLREQAAYAYDQVKIGNTANWLNHRETLRKNIISQAGIDFYAGLHTDIQENGRQQMNGYTVRNIRFQTRPGVYATASLYVPEGSGPFPAVLTTHGHWDGGRRADLFQSVGHSLAQNGYVCLVMDAWGAGERTSRHEVHEYHGSNLGASVMNVGKTLLGMQVTDNIRGLDLLASFPFVDSERIGATGASGGGNQAMWLAAIDERVKAVVPVVSVGTFQSYVMNSNCICELLPDGLLFTEEAGVLGLIAPRALHIFNATADKNPSFTTAEMLRSYQGALPIFRELNAEKQIKYTLFQTGHGYPKEMREAMLGWFNLLLKNTGEGQSQPEEPFRLLTQRSLATYKKGEREQNVITTAQFVQAEGSRLRAELMRRPDDAGQSRKELTDLLKVGVMPDVVNVKTLGVENGWEKLALENSEGNLIPILHRPPRHGKQYSILFSGGGKDSIPTSLIQASLKDESGLVIIDLWGSGEQASASATKIDGHLPPYHTLARSALWMGKTVMGQWVKDIHTTVKYLRSKESDVKITLKGVEEAGVAAILFGALFSEVADIVSINSPYSYLFDTREGVDRFNMSVHIPGFLVWGDLSLAASLSSAQITLLHPKSMSGNTPSAVQLEEVKAEYAYFEERINKRMKTIFRMINS